MSYRIAMLLLVAMLHQSSTVVSSTIIHDPVVPQRLTRKPTQVPAAFRKEHQQPASGGAKRQDIQHIHMALVER